MMKKKVWQKIIDIAITVLTAIGAALTATSCAGHGPLW